MCDEITYVMSQCPVSSEIGKQKRGVAVEELAKLRAIKSSRGRTSSVSPSDDDAIGPGHLVID